MLATSKQCSRLLGTASEGAWALRRAARSRPHSTATATERTPRASVSAPSSTHGGSVSIKIRGVGCRTVTISPPPGNTQPASFRRALRLSLRRHTLSAEQLVELAAEETASLESPWLPHRGAGQPTGPAPCEDALLLPGAARRRRRLEAVLRQWREDAAADDAIDQQMAVPGVADAAVVTRGGRQGGRAKPNQDAVLLRRLACPSGEAPALLLGVFDGHGTGGGAAAQAAVGGLAGAVPAMRTQLLADAGVCGGEQQGCSSGTAAAAQDPALAQQALVTAFQAVAAAMRYDAEFFDCGAAGVACLVEQGSITAAWAGDCRAVVGLSVEGPARPTVLVHALTQDHKPGSRLEQARVRASQRGRVLRLRPGQRQRLCGGPADATLGLSRALGDVWAEPLGLTSEPDAVTVMLPAAAPVARMDGSPGPASPLDSLVSGSCGTCDAGDAFSPPARHVLLLGCDGLWDVVGNAEAVAIALSSPSAAAAASALLHAAQRKWAAAHGGVFADDITVAVAFLPA